MLDLSTYNNDQLYNLFKKMFNHYNATWSTGNHEINIIGIRGLKKKKEVEFNANNVFNDSIFLAYKDGNKKVVKEYHASCEPGLNAVKYKQENGGAAYLADGIHEYKIGWHNKYKELLSKYSDSNFPRKCYQCLEPNPNVQIRRVNDKNSDGKITNDELSEKLFDNDTVQIHYGGTSDSTEYYSKKSSRLDSWSYGCQLIQGKSKYKEFMKLVINDTSIKKNSFASGKTKYKGGDILCSGTRSVIYLLTNTETVKSAISLNWPVQLGDEEDDCNSNEYYKNTEKN